MKLISVEREGLQAAEALSIRVRSGSRAAPTAHPPPGTTAKPGQMRSDSHGILQLPSGLGHTTETPLQCAPHAPKMTETKAK